MFRSIGVGVGVLVIAATIFLWSREKAPVRIGMVPFTSVNERVLEGFKAVLAEHGYRESETVEYRILPADGQLEGIDARVAQLLTWKPALVLSSSTPPSQAAYRVTKASATPLIFAPVSDPIDAKIVANLTHPGEHATGVRLEPSNGLRLQWLLRVVPGVRKIYMPYTQIDKSAIATLKQVEEAAWTLGVQLLLKPVLSQEDIQQAAREIPPDAQAVFLPQDSRIESQIELFVESARQRRLPLSAPSALQVEKGALMSYGFDHLNIGRQAGRLAVEVLHGRKPGELPVETAENVLYINQRTAEAIGLKIDDTLLRQARKIIH